MMRNLKVSPAHTLEMVAITVHCTLVLLLDYCHFHLTIAYRHCDEDYQHVMIEFLGR